MGMRDESAIASLLCDCLGKGEAGPEKNRGGGRTENRPSLRAGKCSWAFFLPYYRGYIIVLSRIVPFHLEWDFWDR